MIRDSKLGNFLQKNSEGITVEVLGKTKEFKILRTMQFTSDRKLMSVVV